ncbi:hypothetical protein [Vibrio phage VP16C]|nr:hypothetical protein [Vibrio phage VP16C]
MRIIRGLTLKPASLLSLNIRTTVRVVQPKASAASLVEIWGLLSIVLALFVLLVTGEI